MSAAVISAAPGTSAPPFRPGPRSAGNSCTAAIAAPTPTGTFTKKIQCQFTAEVSTPPSNSPTAPPAEATKL